MLKEREIVVDYFCGGGGASAGIEKAGLRVHVAVNHDEAAIRMHMTNHPNTKHYQSDVFELDPIDVTRGRPVSLFWLSPDCKHHSKAKGGKPLNKNIRSLAWVGVRFCSKVKPRVVVLENVEEFRDWGPLTKDNRPDPKRKGETFNFFVYHLRRLGYQVEWRELTSSDYGSNTKRKRLFIIARCDGRPIVWPEITHGDPRIQAFENSGLEAWNPVSDILDFDDLGHSIFNRKKPLVENTMNRIARGFKKFVIDDPDPFVLPVENGIITTPFIKKDYGTGTGQSMKEPIHTITSQSNHFSIVAPYLIQYHSERKDGEVRGQSLKEPIRTIDASNRYGLVSAFICKHYGGNYSGAGSSMKEPLHTITQVDHNALVTAHFGADDYTESHSAELNGFLMKYYGNDIGQSLKEPIHTITTKDRFALVTVIHGIQYRLFDIKMRMLQPPELFRGMDFPENYIIDRDYAGRTFTKKEQTGRAGNAVSVKIAEVIVRANLPEYARDEFTEQVELLSADAGY